MAICPTNFATLLQIWLFLLSFTLWAFPSLIHLDHHEWDDYANRFFGISFSWLVAIITDKKLDVGNHTGCSRGGPGGDHGDDVDSVHGVHGVHVGQGVHGGQGRWLGLINDWSLTIVLCLSGSKTGQVEWSRCQISEPAKIKVYSQLNHGVWWWLITFWIYDEKIFTYYGPGSTISITRSANCSKAVAIKAANSILELFLELKE